MRNTCIALFTVLLVSVFATAAPAAKELTKLTIVVLDPKDKPVPKAAVTVTFISGHKMFVKHVRSEWNTKTSSKGTAELPVMPPGKVRLQVIASGFKTYGGEFEINGKEFTQTVKLQRSKGDQFSAHEAEPAPEKPPEKRP